MRKFILVICALLFCRSLALSSHVLQDPYCNADWGDMVAQINRANSYASGANDYSQSWIKAYYWYSIALGKGTIDLKAPENKWLNFETIKSDAKTARKDAATHLTPEQIQEVDKRAVEWNPAIPPVTMELANAEQGDADAQMTLAYAYRYGQDGAKKNSLEAINWFERSAMQGKWQSMAELAGMYRGQWGVQPNYPKAYFWELIIDSDRKDYDPDMPKIASHLSSDEISEAKKRAASWTRHLDPAATQAFNVLKSRASKGDIEAQRRLGDIFRDGVVILVKSKPDALRWYRMAADNGDARAMLELQRLGDHWALDILRSKAEAGDLEAQKRMAEIYVMGWGVKADAKEAMKWRTRAASQGDVKQQYDLALMYWRGDAGKPDYVEAAKWFRMLAEQDNKSAQSDLGRLYYKGQGVQQDMVEAYFWLNLGDATGWVKELDPQLSQKQKEITKVRIEKWKIDHPPPSIPPDLTRGFP